MADNGWVGSFAKSTAAARPTVPQVPTGTFGLHYATDTGDLSVGDGSTWATAASLGASAPSTSANVRASGASVSASSSASFTLDAPFAGAIKPIMLSSTTTTTSARTWTLASGNLQSTASSTYTSITANGPGQSCLLVGQSTSRYTVMVNNGMLLA